MSDYTELIANGHWAGFIWGHCRKEECPISAKREGKA